jgi:two-component system chemotaxis sensor kinase CheA
MQSNDEYRQSFHEEAREIFVEWESSLLALHDNPNDNELIQRSFRALHALKGSGSMFGFDKVAVFAHSLETAFDEVREGRREGYIRTH